jgi:hypothetical protein
MKMALKNQNKPQTERTNTKHRRSEIDKKQKNSLGRSRDADWWKENT